MQFAAVPEALALASGTVWRVLLRSLLFAGWLTAFVPPASADVLKNITAGEIALLPEYCPDTQTFSARGFREGPTERQRYWIARIGDTFWALHHYCWALIKARRAEAAGITPEQRQYLFSSAVSECFFVLDNMSAGFPLLPEVLTRMGQFSVRAGKPGDALQFFERAIQAKADYWPPYLEIANLQAELGLHEAAREKLRAGLKLMPDEVRLRERLGELERSRRPPAPTARPPKGASAP